MTIEIIAENDVPTVTSLSETDEIRAIADGESSKITLPNLRASIGNASGITDMGDLTLVSEMNFPAATKGDRYRAVGTACYVGGDLADGAPWVNEYDTLECLETTEEGTYAQVGGYWRIDPQVISLSSGRRLIALADNPDGIDVVEGENGLGFDAGKLLKEEAGVLYPMDGNVYRITSIPASSFTPDGTYPAIASGESLSFAAASETLADFYFPAPEEWDLGTLKIRTRFRLADDSGAVGNTVQWKAKLSAIRNGDAWALAYGTAQVIQDIVLTGENATQHTTGWTPAITPGGTPAVSCMLHLQISRDTDNDNCAAAALLDWVDVLWMSTKSVTGT